MPRVSSVDPCLICQALPCECNKSAARPRTRKVAPSRERATPSVQDSGETTNPPVATRQSMLERMRARAAQAPAISSAPVRARPTAASAELKGLTPDDAIEVAAIRALSDAFSLEGDAVEKWRPYLEREPSRAERAAAWRMRKEEQA
jgi:hypothetical protein